MRKLSDVKAATGIGGCTLVLTGEEDEVVTAAVDHAVGVHGHPDRVAAATQVRAALTDERPAGRYGTVMVATLTGSLDAVLDAAREWVEERHAPGFLGEEVLVGDDGRTLVTPVWFASREEYVRLADDPEQDRWWSERMAPHLTDVRWVDGTWQQALAPRAPAVPAQAGG